jgi:beta-N-acetylhexosaminidase
VTADRQVTQVVQSLASAGATARVQFFIAANQEGGQVQELQGPGFSEIPSAMAQGQLSAAELQRQAAAWGRELRSAGVNLDLAPVMDVVPAATASQNAPIGAVQREFGHTPQATGTHGVAFIRGMRQAGVATTAKHFPGLGLVTANTDFAAGVVDTTTEEPVPRVVPGGHHRGSAVRHGRPSHLHAHRSEPSGRLLLPRHARAAAPAAELPRRGRLR